MDNALRTFLSNENIQMHKEHLRNLRLKYSILEKSIPILKGAAPYEISHLKIKRSDREEALRLKCDIVSHEIYFESFTDKYAPSPVVCEHYGSENAFIYEAYKTARGKTSGFMYITLASAKRPIIYFSDEFDIFALKYIPILALDLCEHAAFYDYGFEHDKYIENALAHLNLVKLSKTD